MNITSENGPMKRFAVGLAFLLLVYSAEAQKPQEEPQNVSYCDLVKAPLSFSGKRIRVRAIYRYGFEIQRLDPPTCCPNVVKIWVEIEGDLERNSRKLFGKFPKGMGLALATFVGTLESGGPFGDGGYRLKFNVDRIESLEATAKPSPGREPLWVPKDCKGSAIEGLSRRRVAYSTAAPQQNDLKGTPSVSGRFSGGPYLWFSKVGCSSAFRLTSSSPL